MSKVNGFLIMRKDTGFKFKLFRLRFDEIIPTNFVMSFLIIVLVISCILVMFELKSNI